MGRKIDCGCCGEPLSMPRESAPTLIEMACWKCDAVNVVNQYKYTVEDVLVDV